ncbi:restriction endonuclease subunit S [Aetokthonos hydrillicola Thurmond2011]|jgi:type I restriction enzyme S subunit|uniref:Restriction endonuclease subunit S n=1 Tax=Aetokthonos hydrillicola Thurmond2011 TaxID=2712845 RepID=A0AAP5ICK3_9CYAN|nr:restriction endonuclease subunit S [Aetokthonos hydrillicola]MBO3463378.1 restriction endonuclease subunit S [Aetokthonos hydrillicola CCALA 1050]MBW4590493.1 restriction endonuclease subunit S [Aetokthonos hydrillicola CCALA 1050]MDR9899033.1 restriction endonuclease subunit S [Aetokthonos hydrillicola Thurmond2011]
MIQNQNFENKCLRDIASKNKFSIVDGPFGTQLHASEYQEEGIPVVRVVNTTYEGRFDSRKLVFISLKKANSLKRSEVKPGDIVIAKTGATIGKSGIFPDTFKRGIIASSCIKISVDTEIADCRYVNYLIQSHEGQNKITDAAGGSTRTTINTKPFGDIRFNFPSYKEQTQIAVILTSIDRAIEQTEGIIVKQKRIKTALLQNLLTKGIDEHGNIRSEVTHEFKNSPLGRIPVVWKVKTLREIGKWFSGGTPSKTNEAYWDGIIPWVCPKDMKVFDLHGTIEMISEKGATYGSKRMPANSVFIVVRGMILAHSFPVCFSHREMAFNQDVKAIISNDEIESRYLAYWFVANSSRLLRIVTTSTHGTKRLDMHELLEVNLSYPQRKEQIQIISLLDNVERNIELNHKQLLKLRAQKTGLMQDLLTGKVRVTNLLDQPFTPT